MKQLYKVIYIKSMPGCGTFRACSRANGNSQSILFTTSFNEDSAENLNKFDVSALTLIESIIRAKSDPDTEVPTYLPLTSDNDVICLKILIDDSGATVGLTGDAIIFLEINNGELYFRQPVTELAPAESGDTVVSNIGASTTITVGGTGSTTADIQTTTDAIFNTQTTLTASYDYSDNTNLIITLSDTTSSLNIVINLNNYTDFPSYTPYNAANQGAIETNFSVNVVSSTDINGNVYPFDTYSNYMEFSIGDTTGYITQWESNLNAENRLLFVSLYAAQKSSGYVFYDPSGTQTPTPSSTLLAGLISDLDTVTGGPTTTIPDYNQTLAERYFLFFQHLAKYVYENPSEGGSCGDGEGSGRKANKSDSTNMELIEVVLH